MADAATSMAGYRGDGVSQEPTPTLQITRMSTEHQGGSNIGGRSRNNPRKKPVRNHLKIMSLNARSLKNKMGELIDMAKIQNPHIIAVTETWATDEINDAFYNLENYILYRNDRYGSRGGV